MFKLFRHVEKIRTAKKEIWFQIVAVFILPVLLLQTGIIPLNARVAVLVITVSAFVILLLKQKWTLKTLHIETHNLKKFILPYALFTAAGILLIAFAGEKIGQEEFVRWWTNKHFIYLFLIVSIFQEVAYRGYLIPALQKAVASPALVIFLNTLLFTYMHSIFPNPEVNLLLAAIGGLGFAVMYVRYPNLILITASHAILNFCAVYYGFFTIH
jgi:membrane protease YdiL (CAAX protease family)